MLNEESFSLQKKFYQVQLFLKQKEDDIDASLNEISKIKAKIDKGVKQEKHLRADLSNLSHECT